MRNLRKILYSYWQQKSSTAVVDDALWAVQPCGEGGGGDLSFEKFIFPRYTSLLYNVCKMDSRKLYRANKCNTYIQMLYVIKKQMILRC